MVEMNSPTAYPGNNNCKDISRYPRYIPLSYGHPSNEKGAGGGAAFRPVSMKHKIHKKNFPATPAMHRHMPAPPAMTEHYDTHSLCKDSTRDSPQYKARLQKQEELRLAAKGEAA
jgi:hypothetical protein